LLKANEDQQVQHMERACQEIVHHLMQNALNATNSESHLNIGFLCVLLVHYIKLINV